MLAIVVLFTIFVGLVGLLIAIGECQKRYLASRNRRDLSDKDLFEQLQMWLASHQQDVPNSQQIIAILNCSLQRFSSKEWKELKLEELSGGDGFPTINVSSICCMDHERIKFECKLESVPSVGVACTSHRGERVFCHVQVEWIYALVEVTFRKASEDVLVSVEHREPVRMSLSGAIQDIVQDGERLASSVADDLQVWFESLAIEDAVLNSTVPSVLASDHDDVINNDVINNDVIHDEDEPRHDLLGTTQLQLAVMHDKLASVDAPSTPQSQPNSVTTLSSSPSGSDQKHGECELLPVEEEVKIQLKDEGGNDLPGLVTGNHLERQQQTSEVTRPPLLALAEEEEEEEEKRGSSGANTGLPLSPSWRRSPSYEQLQQIELDPQRLLQTYSKDSHGTPPHLTGPDRRALTLSVSGSEAESVYGADERIPSTLVYEVMDSTGKVRHIVAVTSAHAVKLRRRYPQAKKLHIYNDHCFTATHIKTRLECGVCGSKISGLFGKQAYICQDCQMAVHKHCHFKVEGLCTQSELQNMNLIYPDNTSTVSANY